MKIENCKNCRADHTNDIPDVCVPAALLAVCVFSRGTLTDRGAREVLANLDVHLFWDEIGPIIDRLEEGDYGITPDDDDEETDPQDPGDTH